MKFDFICVYIYIYLKGLNQVFKDQEVVIFKVAIIYYDFVLLLIFS